jgi:hypothetical protein
MKEWILQPKVEHLFMQLVICCGKSDNTASGRKSYCIRHGFDMKLIRTLEQK